MEQICTLENSFASKLRQKKKSDVTREVTWIKNFQDLREGGFHPLIFYMKFSVFFFECGRNASPTV